jgi:hypothetical protein
MTLRQYITWIALGTLLAWGAFVLVVLYLNPETAGVLGFTFFYLSLFLGVAGSLTLLGFVWRYIRHRDDLLFRHVTISFRQGVLLGVLVTGALFLQSQKLLTWWNLILLVVGITLLELFLLTSRRTPPEL